MEKMSNENYEFSISLDEEANSNLMLLCTMRGNGRVEEVISEALKIEITLILAAREGADVIIRNGEGNEKILDFNRLNTALMLD